MEEEKKTIEQEQQLEEANGGKGIIYTNRKYGVVRTKRRFGEK